MSIEEVTVLAAADRPVDHRSVPILAERELGHYPEFREFLAARFDLYIDPLGSPGLLRVGDRSYELVFIGRSGVPHPAGVQINALVPGLEPMDQQRSDTDLWSILHWLVDGVGGDWTSAALTHTGLIYRVPAAQLS